MKIRLLREFMVLAECLNFTKAANKLYMTQPVLSRHIKELEDKFNIELFIRDTHNVTLTPDGVIFLREIQKIIYQYDESISLIRNTVGSVQDKLSILYLGDAFLNLLTEIIAQFQQKYPKLILNYRDADLLDIFNLLKIKEYDIGFVLRPVFIADLSKEILNEKVNFASLSFAQDPLCVAFNAQHPLAQEKMVSLQQVSQYPVIALDPSEAPWAKAYSTDFFHSQNIDFQLYKEYPNIKTCALELELNKEVVLLLPKHRCLLLGKNTQFIEIEDSQNFSYVMEAVWHPNNDNPYLKHFIQQIQIFDCNHSH